MGEYDEWFAEASLTYKPEPCPPQWPAFLWGVFVGIILAWLFAMLL